MDFLDHVAEAKLREAIEAGDFDDFALKGKPLALEDLSNVPADLRMPYKLLKNAGVLPEELEVKKSMITLRDLIDACRDDGERSRLEDEYRAMSLRFELMMERHGRRVNLGGYRAAVMRKLGR